MQVSAANTAAYTPRPAAPAQTPSPAADLTQLAVAQTTGELTGTLVNISA